MLVRYSEAKKNVPGDVAGWCHGGPVDVLISLNEFMAELFKGCLVVLNLYLLCLRSLWYPLTPLSSPLLITLFTLFVSLSLCSLVLFVSRLQKI